MKKSLTKISNKATQIASTDNGRENKKSTKSSLKSLLSILPSVREAEAYLKAQQGSGFDVARSKRMRPQLTEALRNLQEAVLQQMADAPSSRLQALQQLAVKRALEPPTDLCEVINASGVVLHTNLGRAPLGKKLFQRVLDRLSGYVNLEYNLLEGQRGVRAIGVEYLLKQLSGASDGLVTNNNAAAVLLMLTALASEAEVVVSRGELVEIGGGFRVPEIMQQSGVTLVEVGTTNRTRLSDYTQAITSRTRALLKVHRSNFTMHGFVEETSLTELALLARKHNISLWCDQGSASFYHFEQPVLRALETPKSILEMGVQVLSFSADKMLGSVQAGIILGDANSINVMRAHPLFRSLRCDKVRLALLEQTLLDCLQPQTYPEHNPTTAYLERTSADLRPLAEKLLELLQPLKAKGLHCKLLKTESLIGAGTAPDVKVPSIALVVRLSSMPVSQLIKELRQARVPIIARQQQGQVWLDLRTISGFQLPIISDTLTQIVAKASS